MLSALVETVGALGILASVAAKIAELRKEYRRCKKVNANKKPSEEGSMNRPRPGLPSSPKRHQIPRDEARRDRRKLFRQASLIEVGSAVR